MTIGPLTIPPLDCLCPHFFIMTEKEIPIFFNPLIFWAFCLMLLNSNWFALQFMVQIDIFIYLRLTDSPPLKYTSPLTFWSSVEVAAITVVQQIFQFSSCWYVIGWYFPTPLKLSLATWFALTNAMWVEVMCYFQMDYLIAVCDIVLTVEAYVGMKPQLVCVLGQLINRDLSWSPLDLWHG